MVKIGGVSYHRTTIRCISGPLFSATPNYHSCDSSPNHLGPETLHREDTSTACSAIPDAIARGHIIAAFPVRCVCVRGLFEPWKTNYRLPETPKRSLI